MTGCLHGCEYCYAREIALSPTTAAHFPAGFTPLFHHERLSAPANTKMPADADQDPRKRRVLRMLDGRSLWPVGAARVDRTGACRRASRTSSGIICCSPKFPSRYLEFLDQLPPTAWLGTSVDEQKRVRIAEDAFRQISGVRVK